MNRFKFYRIINKILIFIIFFLIAVIISGTLISFLKDERKATFQEQREYSPYTLRGDKAIYSQLGQIRAISQDDDPATIVITPHLEYDAKNISLHEELVKKKEKIRMSILQLFKNKTWINIEGQKEEKIKKELLNEINKELSLGRCSAIYFQEFKVLH